MSSLKRIYINIYIFLLNLFLFNSILEIPLQPLKVKGIPKYKNISILEPGKKLILKDKIILIEEGDSIVNNDLLFLAQVKIGSSSQIFNLILDTGSNIFWVAQNGCSGTHNIKNFFDPSSSTTCQSTFKGFEITYGTGSCSGLYYNDNVEYINNKKFNIKFGVASKAQFQVSGGDGIIGLTKSYQDESLSFIHMLKKSGNTDSTAFSIKFEHDRFTSNIQGKMYIGRHEDFSKNGAQSCPLVFYRSELFWACKLNSLRLKSTNYETKVSYSTPVIFDTGTNSIILPSRYLLEMKAELEKYGCAAANLDSKQSVILCGAYGDVPDLQFEFDGKIFTIPKEYGFHYYSGNTKYLISTITFDDSILPIIGSLFFFLFHTLFDEENEELKFYPLKNEITGGGLSTFTIVVICIASIAVVVLTITIICYCIKNQKSKSDNGLTGQHYSNFLYSNSMY